MRLSRLGAVMLASVAVAAVATTACTSGASTAGQAGNSELLKSKCTMCHTIDRINQAKKDRAGWQDTVARMRAKGAVLTDAEASQIVDHLSQSASAQ